MKDPRIKILLCSDLRYEKPTIEMHYCDKFMALINQDEGKDNAIIEFPGVGLNEEAILRKIDLATFERAMKLAKEEIED